MEDNNSTMKFTNAEEVSDPDAQFRKPGDLLSSSGPVSTPLKFRIGGTKSSNINASTKNTTSDANIDENAKATSEKESLNSAEIKDNEYSPDLPYKEPLWSGLCSDNSFALEVIKNGCLIEKTDISQKKFHIFGRQTDCDIHLEHPSISRYHAVLQYRSKGGPRKDEIGWFLYDMGSTHGTFVNREKIPPNMFIRVKVGFVFKFGGSTRMFILQGPEEDEQPESELSVTEIKQRAQKQKLLFNLAFKTGPNLLNINKDQVSSTGEEEKTKADSSAEPNKREESSGIDWGMGDNYDVDDDEDDESSENGGPGGDRVDFEEIEKREQAFVNDPKKALKNFFDREGCDLNYEFFEKGSSFNRRWLCRVELPVDTGTGKAVYAEADVSGGKKEATVACALAACRMLDAYGVLRKSHQESKKRSGKNWKDDDFYDSDEDTFLDRTGEIERKRQQRLARTGDGEQRVENYDSLKDKLSAVDKEIDRLQQQLELVKEEMHLSNKATSETNNSNKDTLDYYMVQMSQSDKRDTKMESSKLKLRLSELKKEQSKLKKLVEISKPVALPALKEKTFYRPGEKPVHILTGKIKRRKLDLNSNTQKFSAGDHMTGNEAKTIFIGQEEIEVDDNEEEQKPDSSTSGDQILPKTAPKELESRDQDCKLNEISAQKSHDRSGKPPKPRENVPKPPVPRVKKTEQTELADYETLNDPDYAVWMPPEDQTGDGKTSLNKKLGY